jgi:hypothetical protein
LHMTVTLLASCLSKVVAVADLRRRCRYGSAIRLGELGWMPFGVVDDYLCLRTWTAIRGCNLGAGLIGLLQVSCRTN